MPALPRRTALAAGALMGAGPVLAQSAARAGLLVTGQSNAGFFIQDGGIWTLNIGLAALLGLERAWYDPRLNGIARLDGYGLVQGTHTAPEMATTRGGTPLWGDAGAFLDGRSGTDPAQWRRGAAGLALDRFIRELLTPQDRAACLGILWLHTEDDTARLRMEQAGSHAAAIRRHLALIRQAFGRGATGTTALPAFFWLPIPFGSSAEGHRAVRAALAEVAADTAQNCHAAIAQTADSNPRDGTDWSHRDAPDLRVFAQRAAYAIARRLRPEAGLPGPGPRLLAAQAEGASATLLSVRQDQGRSLKASRAALDGRGWSVLDDGARRAVTAVEIVGPDRLRLRHAACVSPPARRQVGYCLYGEQLGRGNAVTDDWSAAGRLPAGLDAAWRLDFPLQATLLPVPLS